MDSTPSAQMSKLHKPSNYDTFNTYAIKENTQSSPLNSPPPFIAFVHYKKPTHASTYSPCAQTPPSITFEQPYTIVWQIHKLLLSHSSTRNTFLMNINTHLGSPLRTQFLHGYTHASTPQDHVNALPNSDLASLSSLPPPQRKPHTTPPNTRAYNSLTPHSTKTLITPLPPNRKTN